MSGIAQRFGITLNQLIAANPQIPNPNLINVGQRIIIPASGTAQRPATITAGVRVRIRQGATWFNGGTIPSCVFQDTWIVSQVNGNRAVLNLNVSGRNSINSPINIANLIAV